MKTIKRLENKDVSINLRKGKCIQFCAKSDIYIYKKRPTNINVRELNNQRKSSRQQVGNQKVGNQQVDIIQTVQD